MRKLYVFDMDGTVVNSIGDIAAAMNRSLSAMGLETYTEEEYCHMVGDGMETLCRRAIIGKSEEDVQKLISLYKEDYLANCCENTRLYDGVNDVISALHGKGAKCAMLSNKPHEQVERIADKIFRDGMFDEIMGYTSKFPVKPAPDSLLYVMDKLGANKSETVFIGDSNVDIRLGKAAGVYSVGVSWGFRGAAELEAEGADAVANNADELLRILTESV